MVRFWAALMALILVGCAPAVPAQGAATPARDATEQADDSLAGRVTARILELTPSAKVERRGPLHLRVTANGTEELYLDNLQQGCRNAPASCDERIDTFAHMAVALPDALPSLELLLPTLKNQAFVEQAQRQLDQHGSKDPLVTFAVIDDLRMLLVIDTPAATRFVTEKDVVKLGLTREAARDRALTNLRARYTGFKMSEVAPHLWGLVRKDAYDAAMFLLHPEWEHTIKTIGSAPVVVPIGRDIVLFAGVDSTEGLKTLALILKVERTNPAAAYPVTTQPYRWTPEGWARFDVKLPD